MYHYASCLLTCFLPKTVGLFFFWGGVHFQAPQHRSYTVPDLPVSLYSTIVSWREQCQVLSMIASFFWTENRICVLQQSGSLHGSADSGFFQRVCNNLPEGAKVQHNYLWKKLEMRYHNLGKGWWFFSNNKKFLGIQKTC